MRCNLIVAEKSNPTLGPPGMGLALRLSWFPFFVTLLRLIVRAIGLWILFLSGLALLTLLLLAGRRTLLLILRLTLVGAVVIVLTGLLLLLIAIVRIRHGRLGPPM